jgi:hypothetical protein
LHEILVEKRILEKAVKISPEKAGIPEEDQE